MSDWQYQPYQGVNPGLLQDQVNAPNKQASGLSALTNSAFPGINNSIQQLVQSGRINKLISSLLGSGSTPQLGINMSAQGGQSGMPNPMQQSIGQQTTMMQDPLGLLGGGRQQGGMGLG